MARSIARAMDDENLNAVGHISRTKLSNAGPRFLNVRSNRLRGSVRATKAVASAAGVESSIGTNVKYAGVHEFGFRGTVAVRVFQRRAPQGDKFLYKGTVISRMKARETGLSPRTLEKKKVSSGRAFVRSHSRRVDLPSRAMFRTGIEERADNYRNAISAAILRAWTGEQGGGA